MALSSSEFLGAPNSELLGGQRSFFRALEALVAARRALKALIALISRWESFESSSSHSEWLGGALTSSEWLGVARSSWAPPTRSSSECCEVARSCLEANCKLF